MPRRYKSFLHVVGNGRTEAQAGEALGVTAATICRDLAELARQYPGLECVYDLCRRVHQGERSPLANSQAKHNP